MNKQNLMPASQNSAVKGSVLKADKDACNPKNSVAIKTGKGGNGKSGYKGTARNSAV